MAYEILRNFTGMARSDPSLLRQCWQIQKSMCQILRKFTRNPRPDASLPREGEQVRKRTAPLARERRNLRSESNVFYHLLFGRIAPLASQSARHARILDRGGRSGPPALISAGPRVGLRIWQKTPKFITENLGFAYGLPYGWSCRRLPGATAR